MRPEAWERFLRHAAYLRGNPRFDAEERSRGLEIAERVRHLVDAAEADDGLGSALDALFASVSDPEAPYRLIARAEREWLAEWASRDETSLREALGAFADATGDPESAFTSFAAAARQAQTAGTMKEQAGARITVGSLLNFGHAPELSPVVRVSFYGVLERMVGFPDRVVRSIADRYQHHLSFARAVREHLENAGVGIRDMLDVQGAIFPTAVALSRRAVWTAESSPAPLPRPQPRSKPNGAYLAACSCLGYDTAYLLEWIEFHRLVGIERFFLYNNGDREAQRELLQPYVEEGMVVLYDWTLFPPQIPAARHCLAAHSEDARWIAFVDTDEFLFSPSGTPLTVLLTSYERWPGVGVNGANFGTSGHREKPEGLVIENYLNRLGDSHVKLIVDPRRTVDCVTPHCFTYKEDSYAVDENGYPIVGAQTSYISFSRFRLNHYFTKSEAEFRKKATRTRPDFGAERDHERLAKQLEALTKLGKTDSDILQFVPALRASLERRGQ